MAKFRPGIPDDFQLDVRPVADLGDYLDEPAPTPHKVTAKAPPPEPVRRPSPPPPASNRVKVEASPVVTPARRVEVSAAAAVAPAAVTTPPVTSTGPANREERGLRPKAPRREISMTPDTLRMSDELLDMIRRGSGQRDTKASEMFHALVLLVHEVKDELDLHTIPKRGRWGSPTARAYPLELKNASLQALLKKYTGVLESPTGLQYPVNSTA